MSNFFGLDILAIVSGGAIASRDNTGTPPSANPTDMDEEMAEAVEEILTELGKILEYKVSSTDDYDASAGTIATGIVSSHFEKSIPPYQVALGQVDGTTIQIGDLVTGIAGQGLTFIPEKNMTVVIDGQVWKIAELGPIYSGEQIALYLLILRKT